MEQSTKSVLQKIANNNNKVNPPKNAVLKLVLPVQSQQLDESFVIVPNILLKLFERMQTTNC